VIPPGSVGPGTDPGAPRTVGTMVAVLYGDLVPHSWRRLEPEGDAYSLFYQRSLAMGWLDDLGSGGSHAPMTLRAGGLWSMNDAGWGEPLIASGKGLAGWFQVEVGVVAPDRALPVQPFLRCAGDVMGRAGSLQLEAVQLVLPIQGLRPTARPLHARVPSMLTMYWFHESNPASRVQVEINVNSGQDPVMSAIAPRLVTRLSELDQKVFSVLAGTAKAPHRAMASPIDDRLWGGPPGHGVTVTGGLVEWSLDAIGWVCEVIADLGAALGAKSPLLITASRVGAGR
jgi:hypothetical protein